MDVFQTQGEWRAGMTKQMLIDEMNSNADHAMPGIEHQF